MLSMFVHMMCESIFEILDVRPVVCIRLIHHIYRSVANINDVFFLQKFKTPFTLGMQGLKIRRDNYVASQKLQLPAGPLAM
jgi:hypothetical protein